MNETVPHVTIETIWKFPLGMVGGMTLACHMTKNSPHICQDHITGRSQNQFNYNFWMYALDHNIFQANADKYLES